jgi:uncharacterized oxidoreductase
MDLTSNTILITGGASGIGLALAERFLQHGSEVIICGRREGALEEVLKKHGEHVHVRRADIAKEEDRLELFRWATKAFPQLNVLVNNAGIQRRINLLQSEQWEQTHQEIAVNLEGPLHLSMLFAPFLRKQQNPAIVNITSGLAFTPLTSSPVYCATKAALRSYTLSLRYQLRDSPVKVIEVVPPAVNTDLGGVGHHPFGVPVDEFADAVMRRLAKGDCEIAYGTAEKLSRASREDLDRVFERMNRAIP